MYTRLTLTPTANENCWICHCLAESMFGRACTGVFTSFAICTSITLPVEAPTTAVAVFKSVLCCLNTLGETCELLEGANRLNSIIQSSQEHIRSLEHYLLMHPAKLESLESGVRHFEASFKAFNRQASASQAVIIAAEAEHDQNRALIDEEEQSRRYLGVLFAPALRLLGNHWTLLCSSQRGF